MLENYYITGLPIALEDNLGTIYQPTIKEILERGCSNIDIVQPFLLHKGLYEGLSEEDDIANFDLFFFGEIEVFIQLISSLRLFYRVEDDDINLDGQKIVIKDIATIDRDNFDYLADVILEMFMTSRPEKPEAKNKYEDAARQRLWEKLQRKRAEADKKNALEMCDIINIVCHAEGFIPYSQILDLTYYQLINTYQMMMTIGNYKDYIQYKLSSKYEIKQDVKHWIKDAKIKRSAIK